MSGPGSQVRVGVVGAAGRMGERICVAVAGASDLQLVAAVGARSAGQEMCGIRIAGDLDALTTAACDVVVDVSVAEAARQTLPFLASHGIHAVVGTTGLTVDDIATIRAAFTSSNCLIASNFAIGAVLMMRFAELAAPHFDTVEVIELHHDQKVDAPSGTALATAQRIAAASSTWAADPTKAEVLDGARGGRGPAGIRVHSIRMRGMVAHQEVILGAEGQTLTIRQDSYDRSSYMPGVLLACRQIANHAGLTIGLDSYLGI